MDEEDLIYLSNIKDAPNVSIELDTLIRIAEKYADRCESYERQEVGVAMDCCAKHDKFDTDKARFIRETSAKVLIHSVVRGEGGYHTVRPLHASKMVTELADELFKDTK